MQFNDSSLNNVVHRVGNTGTLNRDSNFRSGLPARQGEGGPRAPPGVHGALDAGLDLTHIDLSNAPVVFWQAIVEEAGRAGKTETLLEEARQTVARIDAATTDGYARQLEGIYQNVPEVNTAFVVVAPGLERPNPVNTSLSFVMLKPWEERTRSQIQCEETSGKTQNLQPPDRQSAQGKQDDDDHRTVTQQGRKDHGKGFPPPLTKRLGYEIRLKLPRLHGCGETVSNSPDQISEHAS